MAYIQIPAFSKSTNLNNDDEFVIVVDGKEHLVSFKTLSEKFGNSPELLAEINAEIEALRNIVDAFPSENPAAPIALKISDTPIIDGLYKPTEAGTYPDAGGLEYDPTEGITYFIRTQGVWSKDVTPVNFTPTGVVEEGNTQAVSGGEVYEKTLTNEVILKTKDDCQLGYYDLTGAQPSELLPSTNNICGVFDITEADKVFIEYARGGTNSRAWAFVDENNNILTRASTQIWNEKTEIPIPLGAVSLYINSTFASNNIYRDQFKLTLETLIKPRFEKTANTTEQNSETIKTFVKETKDISIFQSGYYDLTGAQPSELLSSSVTRSAIIDVTNINKVDLIKIYGGASSRAYAFTDINNDIILVAENNARFDIRTLQVPENAVHLYVNSSVTESSSYPFSELRVNLYYGSYPLIQEIENLKNKETTFITVNPFLPKRTDGYNGVKNTFSLAGTDIALNGNNYYTKGYLFTEYPENNGKVYYSNSVYDIPSLIADFGDAYGANMQVAISPKHRSLIRGVYDGSIGVNFRVFENEAYSNITFAEAPFGWLYNFGQYFGEDANGDEYFLCGEYSHNAVASRRIFKATYPYSEQANWKVVHEFISPEIHHIHQIVKDNYTNILYCFTGDSATESNIYYSNDEGETWQLLTRSQDIGSGTNAVLRVTNVHFLEDKILYASDDDYHVLVEIYKDVNGLLDISTLNIITPLKSGQMTNASYYDYNTNRLYMMDRVRVADSTLEIYCYDFNESKLIKVADFKQTPTTTNALWGNRGRSYIVYPNNSDRIFGMGISNRIALQIYFPENDNNTYGGLYYKF